MKLAANTTARQGPPDRFSSLIKEVEGLCHAALGMERRHKRDIAAMPPDTQKSARNLLHYLGLRQHDIRSLQTDLARLGLSSLGRAESHVLAMLDAVLTALSALARRKRSLELRPPVDFDEGPGLLARNAESILGPRQPGAPVRIMVTMPSESASDPDLIRCLLDAGMNLMRVNCAHDGPDEWRRMVDRLREAEAQTGRRCRVEMDLAGPKARTARLEGDVQQSHKGPFLSVNVGDRLLLKRDRASPPRHGSNRRAAGGTPTPCITCTLSELVAALRPGERVAFDDGKIEGVVRSIDRRGGGATIEIVATRKAPGKLRADKGINAPETAFSVPALTPKDMQDLDAVVSLADIVAFSFVHTADDVAQLDDELRKRGDLSKPIILKIETKEAFENMPRLMLASMQRRPTGVMVGRGDLGVEVGFDRLAELQEEILWLAEAAHVPMIWATEVLDRMARKGLPSRAEVTDAAMGGRAECVMLNKGPHIVEVVRFIRNIHERMQRHQVKKMSMLRRLNVSRMR
jgi:pyruvate kinase